MDKSSNKKFHNLKFFAIIGLLTITPLLSASHRSKYLYFILNILIIALGADAGLLSFFLHTDKRPDDHHHSQNSLNDDPQSDNSNGIKNGCPVGDKSGVGQGVNRSPSNPTSMFFIEESGDGEEEDEESEQELYHKAETFIGKFYRQLKMQREESWNNKLHAHGGLSQASSF